MADRIVSVLRLPVTAGSEDSFIEKFEELEILRHAAERVSMRSARLLRPTVPEEPFLVIAEWDDDADYQRWIDDPMREELRVQLLPYLDAEAATGALYRVAQTRE